MDLGKTAGIKQLSLRRQVAVCWDGPTYWFFFELNLSGRVGSGHVRVNLH
jgi:hypothetical protein